MRKTIAAIMLMLLTVPAYAQSLSQEGATPGMRVNDANAPDAGLKLDRVVILDKSLQVRKKDGKGFVGKIAVERLGVGRTATGSVKVVSILRNRTDFPLQVEGRTQFFDASGLPVEMVSAWKRIYLPPQSVGTYSEVSLRRDVKHYYVEIREGR